LYRYNVEILLYQLQPAILQPAYVLFRDKAAKELFFVIRGTHSAGLSLPGGQRQRGRKG
jgi:hypothetical protein